MTVLRRLLLGCLIGLGLVRAAGYLGYALFTLPSPLETFHLEAKMVLLAYRAELGEASYPAWRDYPHVSNFYGPLYFRLVGLIGRALGSEIPGLFGIGRGVSFAAGLLTSALIGVVAARRYGRAAGYLGGALSLGGASVFGFSVMVRPDLLAESLGVTGFFLAGNRFLGTRFLGGVVLVLAMLTKQTAAIFLVAASLAGALEGSWRRGLWLGLGGAVSMAVVVAAGTLLIEPNFAASLAGDSRTPMNFATFARTSGRFCLLSPDGVYFAALGLGFWMRGATGRREVGPAALAALVLVMSFATSAKRGSDLNYFLSLRAVEALAVATLWRAWAIPGSRTRSAGLATVTLVGCLSLVPGTVYAVKSAEHARDQSRFLRGPHGRELRDVYRQICAMAAAPGSRVLTDSPLVDLYHGRRAEFGDPLLFRIQVETGQIDPELMRRRIDSQDYDLVVTTAEIDRPSYDSYEFGLPRALAERVRARYVRVDAQAGLFLYGRRPGPPGPPGAGGR